MSVSRLESNKKFSNPFSADNSESKFFVEMMENGIMGSISAIINKNKAELSDFYIIEGPDDTGLRTILLERALNYCKSKDIKTVKAVIFPDVGSFFENKGFQRKKLDKNHIVSRHDLLLMTKKAGQPKE